MILYTFAQPSRSFFFSRIYNTYIHRIVCGGMCVARIRENSRVYIGIHGHLERFLFVA